MTSLIASVLIVTAVLLPLIPIVVWAFAYRWYFPDILPSEWSLRAWTYLLSGTSQVSRGVVHGTVVALTATGLSLAIGVPAGRALGLYSFRGKKLVQFLNYLSGAAGGWDVRLYHLLGAILADAAHW
jgi:putative spermidine/putrescine transport system permease protein